MGSFGSTNRSAQGVIRPIEPKTLRQRGPIIRGSLDKGISNDRCVDPGRQRRGSEGGCDQAGQQRHLEQPPGRHAVSYTSTPIYLKSSVRAESVRGRPMYFAQASSWK